MERWERSRGGGHCGRPIGSALPFGRDAPIVVDEPDSGLWSGRVGASRRPARRPKRGGRSRRIKNRAPVRIGRKLGPCRVG
jgi:hypothetical protein